MRPRVSTPQNLSRTMSMKSSPHPPTPEVLTKDFPSATRSPMETLTKENLVGAKPAPTASRVSIHMLFLRGSLVFIHWLSRRQEAHIHISILSSLITREKCSTMVQEPNRNRKPELSNPLSQEPKADPESPEPLFSHLFGTIPLNSFKLIQNTP